MSWHLRPVAINLMKIAVNPTYGDINKLHSSMDSRDELVGDQHHLCRIAGESTIQDHRQRKYRRMWMFLITRGLMKILHGKPSYVFIRNLASKMVGLSNL